MWEYRVLRLSEYYENHESEIQEFANAGWRLVKLLDWGTSALAYFERARE